MIPKLLHWKKFSLAELGIFKNGINYSSDKEGGETCLINVKDLFTDIPIINFDSLDTIDSSGINGIEKFTVKENDLFFVRSSVKRNGVGLVCLSPKSNSSTVHCGFIIRFRIFSKDVDPAFLVFLLRSSYYRNLIIGKSSGATITNISQDSLGSVEVFLPPLSTQIEISSTLTRYNDLIKNNTRRIRILEEMAQAIYREWFVHFRYPGHEFVPLVESELGMIPEGWGVVKVGDIAREIRRGVQPNAIDPETPYLGLEHLPRKSLAISEWGTAQEIQSTKLAFHKGEILFGKIRPYFHKVGIAPIDGICSTDIIVIYSTKEEYFPLTLMTVFSTAFVDHATQTSQGTKMPRANWEILVNYPIVLAPSTIIIQFNDVIFKILALIQNLCNCNRNLRQQRDLLLPRLVSGELDVSQLEQPVIEDH